MGETETETETEPTTGLVDARDAYRAALEIHAKARAAAEELRGRVRVAQDAVTGAENAVIKAEQRLLRIAGGL